MDTDYSCSEAEWELWKKMRCLSLCVACKVGGRFQSSSGCKRTKWVVLGVRLKRELGVGEEERKGWVGVGSSTQLTQMLSFHLFL